MPLSSVNARKLFFWALHLALAGVFCAELFARDTSPNLDAALVVLVALASIMALARQLPLQNVLLAAAIIAAAGGIAHGISARSSLCIPFGPIVFNSAAGEKLFNAIPWTIPLLWIAVIFISRGVARLILRPWRKLRNYGFKTIGATAALSLAFDIALEPFATHAKHWWLWTPTKFPLTFLGTPLINFLGWFFVTLLMLAFITPSLIRKQPGGGATDYQPLVLWLGALVLCGIGAAQNGFWLTVFLDALIAIITSILAVRGARW